MLALGHEIADSSRAGDAETEIEAVFEDRGVERAPALSVKRLTRTEEIGFFEWKSKSIARGGTGTRRDVRPTE